jgi:hypothetical protein
MSWGRIFVQRLRLGSQGFWSGVVSLEDNNIFLRAHHGTVAIARYAAYLAKGI